jgi:hypothetical protein
MRDWALAKCGCCARWTAGNDAGTWVEIERLYYAALPVRPATVLRS